MSNQEKLEKLAQIEGLSVEELLEKAVLDSVSPSICCNPECDYTTTMEPDQGGGYCENCSSFTVASCLVLAGII